MRYLLAIPFIAYVGLCLLVSKRYKINSVFSPAIVSTSICVIMSLAGILNLLVETVIVLYLLGFSTLVYNGVKWVKQRHIVIDKTFVHTLTCRIIIWGGIFLLIGLWRFRSVEFLHWDDYNHWATASRYVINQHALPSFKSSLITFQAYPTGAACFHFFFGYLTGYSESMVAFFQYIFSVTCALSILGLVKPQNYLGMLLSIFGISLALVANTPLDSLLVDTLLPMVAFSAIVIILYYRNDIEKAIFCTLPIIPALYLIKNSGMFYALVAIVCLWYIAYKAWQTSHRRLNRKSIFLLVLPLLCLLSVYKLWIAHVDYSYLNGTVSYHAMTFDNLQTRISTQLIPSILETSKLMLSESLTLKPGDVLCYSSIGVLLISAIVMHLLDNRAYARKFLHASIGLIFLLIAYQLGLIGMYALERADSNTPIILFSYNRYILSTDVYLFLIAIAIVIHLTQQSLTNLKAKHQKIGTTCLTLAMIVVFAIVQAVTGVGQYQYYLPNYQFSHMDGNINTKNTLEACADKYIIQDGDAVLVIISGHTSPAYFTAMCRYVFGTNRLDVMIDPDDLSTVDSYHFVFYLGKDREGFRRQLHEYYGDNTKAKYYILPENMSLYDDDV